MKRVVQFCQLGIRKGNHSQTKKLLVRAQFSWHDPSALDSHPFYNRSESFWACKVSKETTRRFDVAFSSTWETQSSSCDGDRLPDVHYRMRIQVMHLGLVLKEKRLPWRYLKSDRLQFSELAVLFQYATYNSEKDSVTRDWAQNYLLRSSIGLKRMKELRKELKRRIDILLEFSTDLIPSKCSSCLNSFEVVIDPGCVPETIVNGFVR